jgi:hypothetical protein
VLNNTTKFDDLNVCFHPSEKKAVKSVVACYGYNSSEAISSGRELNEDTGDKYTPSLKSLIREADVVEIQVPASIVLTLQEQLQVCDSDKYVYSDARRPWNDSKVLFSGHPVFHDFGVMLQQVLNWSHQLRSIDILPNVCFLLTSAMPLRREGKG